MATISPISVEDGTLLVEAKDRPKARNVHHFEPEDYPDREVRSAIVAAAFNNDGASIAFLHACVGIEAHDDDGQLTLVLTCLASGDDGMRSQLAGLAGKIVVRDKKVITVSKLSKGEVWARRLKTPIDQQIAESQALN